MVRLCDLLAVTRLEICGSYVIVAPSVLVSLRLRQVKTDFSKCFPFSNKIHHFVAKFIKFFSFPSSFSCWKSYIYLSLIFQFICLSLMFLLMRRNVLIYYNSLWPFLKSCCSTVRLFCILVYFHQQFSSYWDLPFFLLTYTHMPTCTEKKGRFGQ